MKVTAVLLVSILFVVASAKPTSRRINLPQHLPTHSRTSIRKRNAAESLITKFLAMGLHKKIIMRKIQKVFAQNKKTLAKCRTLKLIFKFKIDCRTLRR